VALACEAANRRDFREREFGSAQQILGAVDAVVKKPLVRCHTRRENNGMTTPISSQDTFVGYSKHQIRG
jgi:hypothetical protein